MHGVICIHAQVHLILVNRLAELSNRKVTKNMGLQEFIKIAIIYIYFSENVEDKKPVICQHT